MRRGRLAIAALCFAALAAGQAGAQALNAAWTGDWVAAEASQGRPGMVLRILRKGSGTQIVQDGQACALAYDGTVTAAALQAQADALRRHQLDPAHWPPGTRTEQLVGLQREFERAGELLSVLSTGAYRRARIRGAGCDDADDVLFVLHNGQRLLRVRFPSASLGLDVRVFQRRSTP